MMMMMMTKNQTKKTPQRKELHKNEEENWKEKNVFFNKKAKKSFCLCFEGGVGIFFFIFLSFIFFFSGRATYIGPAENTGRAELRL